MTVTTNIPKLITKLREARALHGFRGETLVPDLAFVGLIDDTIDAAEEALHMVSGPRPHRAYAMVRVAFEAAQRLLVLAATDDYVRLGTRAWLYYVGKDEALQAGRDSVAKVADYRDQIVQTWASRYPNAAAVVAAEMEFVRKIRQPDNFLGRNLATAVGEAHAVIAKVSNHEMPTQVVEATREAYRALCRDAHACMRLELSGMRIDGDGFVDVVEREPDTSQTAAAVAAGLWSSLSEAITSVRFRVARRQEATTAAASRAASEHTGPIEDGFLKDFGLFLLEHNLGVVSQVFPGVVLRHLGILPDGTLSSSTTIGVDDEVYLATFDFKGETARQFLDQLAAAFPHLTIPAHGEEVVLVNLPDPYEAGLVATVGYFKHNPEDRFVPLLVTELFGPE